MFLQTYGTTYYGKRFPIQTTKQLYATVSVNTDINVSKTYLVFVDAIVKANGLIKSKRAYKNILVTAPARTSVSKGISFSEYATTNISSTIGERIILIPLVATNKIASFIKKQPQKISTVEVTAPIFLRKARLYEIEYFGEFAPGDTLIIDTEHLTVTVNGDNVLHLIGKDEFPELLPGENELVYIDSEGQRIVKIRVIWKDRWL